MSTNPGALQIDKINKQIDCLRQKQAKIYLQLETKIMQLLKKHNGLNNDFETLYGMIYDGLLKLESKEINHELLSYWKELGGNTLRPKNKNREGNSAHIVTDVAL